MNVVFPSIIRLDKSETKKAELSYAVNPLKSELITVNKLYRLIVTIPAVTLFIISKG